MKSKSKPCKDVGCPYCKAGIPRKVLVEIFNLQTRKTFFWDMPEKMHNRILKVGSKNGY